MITYYGFLSLFPLLLLAWTVLGFILNGDLSARDAVIGSAVGQFPVIGTELAKGRGQLGGGGQGLAIGLLGAAYGALGVAQAVQNAMNTAWAVPRHKRPNPIRSRLRSLFLLAAGGIAVLGALALSTLAGEAGALRGVRGTQWHYLLTATLWLASVAVNWCVFVLVFRYGTTRSLTAQQVAPGALVAAVFYQLLQSFGAAYVTSVVRNASEANSVFALVLGLLAFLFLASAGTVMAAEINVVRVDRLHPRSLLTPFTDDVELTAGDEKVYTGTAKAAKSKGFEQVDVSFDKGRTDET